MHKGGPEGNILVMNSATFKTELFALSYETADDSSCMNKVHLYICYQ